MLIIMAYVQSMLLERHATEVSSCSFLFFVIFFRPHGELVVKCFGPFAVLMFSIPSIPFHCVLKLG